MLRAPRLFFLLLLLAPPLAAEPVRTEHARASLVAERGALVAGETAWLGLRLEHDPHWHTYWINPGDSGLATRLQWTLPPGFATGDVVWPRPQRLQAGPLTNFGYEGDLLLPVPLAVPDTLSVGAEVEIALRADWLICEEICIPDGADLRIRLPVVANHAGHDPQVSALFERARRRAPQAYPGIAVVAELETGFSFVLRDPPPALLAAASSAELFPLQAQLLDNGRGESQRHGDAVRLVQAKSAFLSAVPGHVDLLVAAGPGADDPAWVVRATFDQAAAAAPARPPAVAPLGLAWALLFAFFGGVLLNLMPCVFPVLSLKALGLAESSGDRAQLRRHGWLYTAGVLASFAALAAVLLLLRAGGSAAGWGFQLQQPWFVAILACLIFVLGLSLSGAVHLGTALMGLGQKQVAAGGDRGAFMTGVLACVVASPCTAPFMGAALGYAVTLPAAAAMAVFLVLGLGLAAPLLLISLVPALSRWLPRPGAWMETFKQAMAFPLYLTALWLLWVLGRQTDFETAMTVLLGMLVIAFALWLWPAPGSLAPTARRAVAILAGALSLWLILPAHDATGRAPTQGPPIAAVGYSQAALSDLLGEGRPVLVNMTADWCITCKVNERAALSSSDFQQMLERHAVVYMVGDWTHSNPDITRYLASFGRNGVPLYVLYPANGGAPEVLPQVLTPGLVRDALSRAAASPP
jgi:thiol:disulfide interchange protein/DsbC/DsbD-like thiol-disulfide interchange protein